jgi:hypothetical protein
LSIVSQPNDDSLVTILLGNPSSHDYTIGFHQKLVITYIKHKRISRRIQGICIEILKELNFFNINLMKASKRHGWCRFIKSFNGRIFSERLMNFLKVILDNICKRPMDTIPHFY